MERLNDKQKNILTGFSEKFAIVVGTTMIVGQFIPGQKPEWIVIVGGSVATALLIIYAVLLNRNRND